MAAEQCEFPRKLCTQIQCINGANRTRAVAAEQCEFPRNFAHRSSVSMAQTACVRTHTWLCLSAFSHLDELLVILIDSGDVNFRVDLLQLCKCNIVAASQRPPRANRVCVKILDRHTTSRPCLFRCGIARHSHCRRQSWHLRTA